MRDWDDDLAELDRSTIRLIDSVATISETQVREPSLLPGWTRGHVLAHIEGNARGLARLARWATDGIERPMYISREVREADITLHASRSVQDHFNAVRQSARELRNCLAAIPAERRDLVILLGSGVEKPAGALPFHRLQEVCVHHADLGLPGYTALEWPDLMCEGMLDNVTRDFAARGEFPVDWVATSAGRRFEILGDGQRGVTGSPQNLLAWLLGRSHNSADLTAVGVAAVPPAPTWR